MEWEILYRHAYSILRVVLEPGEEIWAEPGAFMAGKGSFSISTTSGSILRGLLRAIAGGESVFLNRFRAETKAELYFTPPLPGDIEALNVGPASPWIVQDSSYLAHYGDIDVTVAWRGLKGMLAEGELVWLKLEGSGIAWVNSYGAIMRVDLEPGEEMIVDNFHFVAMNADAQYQVTTIGGLKTLLFGGEGIVIRVRGPTTLYLQTRMLPDFVQQLLRYMPRRR